MPRQCSNGLDAGSLGGGRVCCRLRYSIFPVLSSRFSRLPANSIRAERQGKAQKASRTGGDALALHKREGVHDGRAHALLFLITAPTLTTPSPPWAAAAGSRCSENGPLFDLKKVEFGAENGETRTAFP